MGGDEEDEAEARDNSAALLEWAADAEESHKAEEKRRARGGGRRGSRGPTQTKVAPKKKKGKA